MNRPDYTFSPAGYDSNEAEEKFWNNEIDSISQECMRYGYRVFRRFNQLHIRTRFEAWYFIPKGNGCIQLMHGNGCGFEPQGWHKQFSRKMDYHGLIQYIHEHEIAKYCGKHVDFTFTKTGAYKKVLA